VKVLSRLSWARAAPRLGVLRAVAAAVAMA
jgi:hypothetical protein